MWRSSAVNGPSVKSAGLKARDPAPLGLYSPCSTLNYFTLIPPSGNSSSCSLMQTQMRRVGCSQIRTFLCVRLQTTISVPQCSNKVQFKLDLTQSPDLLLLKQRRGNKPLSPVCEMHQFINLHATLQSSSSYSIQFITEQTKSNWQTGSLLTFVKSHCITVGRGGGILVHTPKKYFA